MIPRGAVTNSAWGVICRSFFPSPRNSIKESARVLITAAFVDEESQRHNLPGVTFYHITSMGTPWLPQKPGHIPPWTGCKNWSSWQVTWGLLITTHQRHQHASPEWTRPRALLCLLVRSDTTWSCLKYVSDWLVKEISALPPVVEI
jgi:hypothetical protein